MSQICLNFQVHQPRRLTNYDFFKIGEHAYYEDDEINTRILNQLAEECYLPANRLMQQLIALSDGAFKFSIAFSGVFLEQCYENRPDVIDSFKELIDTGCVDLLAMPYFASLSSIFSTEDFASEMKSQMELCQQLFGKTPTVMWNTALAYSDAIASQAAQLGLKGAIAEGVPSVLCGRSATDVFSSHDSALKTLYRHLSLSSDLCAHRIDPSWEAYPLAPETFSSWLTTTGGTITLGLEYEVLGNLQKEETGVFEFWRSMILSAMDKGNTFLTAAEVVEKVESHGTCSCPHVITNGKYHSTHNWLSNVLQNEAITKIYQIEGVVKESGDPDLIHVWRKLQTADHFYYMYMDGETFSPFNSPYDMYISYMNALADLHVRVGRICKLKEMNTSERWV